MDQTLAIIKPDAASRALTGKIVSRIESNGLKIIAMKLIHMSKDQAEDFYIEHKERPFFDSLTDYMASGPCYVIVLEGEKAQLQWRDAMGATNPVDAADGTIRKDFGQSLEQNSVHGSDSPSSAAREIAFFFSELEIM
ncbi:MAG TPA: nucleoside-diphosphate kinase [Nitrospinota bacterium]|nr:nucleoside-diphosphate kinase [Nitrospinota bacterium]|tara:strand:- start:33169 stop:33582 length:414 start_codon:yes stop_codon:yes gene_type:complete